MCTAVLVPEIAAPRMSAVFTAELFTKTPALDLAEAIMRLVAAERLVLGLIYFHELAIADVAAVMKISTEDVLTIHANAILRLSLVLSSSR